jgi:hypothetical protein
MNSTQRLIVRRRLERAHKDVVVDLCLRLMEANSALTRQLAHYFIRHPSPLAQGPGGASNAPDAVALQEGAGHE